VHVTLASDDVCDPAPRITLVSVVGSEPMAANDVAGADLGTADADLQLRAVKNRNATARVYTLRYTAIDASGRTTSSETTVTVPVKR